MIEDIDALVATVAKFQPGKPLDRYIVDVVFPNFKNIEPSTKITFDYPLTALVGANGSGKSSILHAMWGMPIRHSTSRFWFSTAVDPIAEGGTHGINRYYYSHWVSELKRIVQTKKVRGKKRSGYWEPARASTADGMDPMPPEDANTAPFRSKERWNPVDRKVIYLNFKCEFSAFDRYFYFAPRGVTLEERQEEIRKGAHRLQNVLKRRLESYAPGGHQAVFEHRDLTAEELSWVSYILGHEYVSARYVLHRLYGRMEAPSVIFTRKNMTYSEAFAGSGELAVVRAVIELLAVEQHSLVLLDEPETSLHPLAQRRFVAFLLDRIRVKHIQVVLSTHSPSIVRMLPGNAIKVLEEGPNGRMRVVENTHPQVAFNRLGHIPDNVLLITVEDQLLAVLVRIAMKLLDPGEAEIIRLHVPTSGANSILKYNIPTWMSDHQDVYVILDGDQKPNAPFPDPGTLPLADQLLLSQKLQDEFGVLPHGCSLGKTEPAASYVRWVRSRMRYLDAICPEFVVLSALIGDAEAAGRAETNEEAKAALVAELKVMELDSDADSINRYAQYQLTPAREKNKYILGLKSVLKEFLAHHALEH